MRELLVKFISDWEDYGDVCDELLYEDLELELKNGVRVDLMTDISDLMFWRSIEQDKTYLYEKRVLIFSPVYPKDSEMRFRCVDSQFVDICKEATHWAKFIDPIKE